MVSRAEVVSPGTFAVPNNREDSRRFPARGQRGTPHGCPAVAAQDDNFHGNPSTARREDANYLLNRNKNSAAITSNTQQSFSVTPNVTRSVTAATVEPGMIVLVDNEEILCTASSGNTCTASQRGWAGTTAATHSAGAYYSGSVHVQYHVTFKPGDTSVCQLDGTSGAAVECVFIDYLIVNNVKYDFHAIYGTQTVGGVAGYSALTVPAYTYTYGIDRVFDQKQIDVKNGISPVPAQVGEFIDRDNVTASYGVLGSNTYVVP